MDTMSKSSADINYIFHKMIEGNPELADLFSPSDPKLLFPEGFRYLYYSVPVGKRDWRYCYSTTRNRNGKFISWVYRPKWELRRVSDKKRGGYKKVMTWNYTKVTEFSHRAAAQRNAAKRQAAHEKRMNKNPQ